jgi:hypothetical protein
VRMSMGDRGHAAERGSNEENGEMQAFDMDDLREDESDEEESDDDHDDEEEDESDDGIESEEEEDNKMAHNFIRTFSNGDYDIEFDNALSLDRNVIPLARATQASYNKPNNWSQINRFGLNNLQDQLQTCINSVTRSSSFKLELRHNHQEDWEMPIVWHDPCSIVNDYWDKLKKAIDRKKHATDIRDIHFENVEMTNFRLATIVDIIVSGRATNSCNGIKFNNANLCGEGIVNLSKLIDISDELNYVILCHNRIDNMDSAHCLSRSIKSHTCINRLCLDHCDLGSNPEILSIILRSDVKIIHLDNNNINSLGAAKIAEYLESNPPIQKIDLHYNRLNDDDAILISQALKRNTNLIIISLHTNIFTSNGVKALLTCVFDSSSLNAISESNHKLVRIQIFNEENNKNLQCCIQKLLQLDRTCKIMLALQDKDSLLQYLANVPVQLIPEVLAFPLQHVDDYLVGQDEHLNVVYSTMRWWNMPLLYSYHHCVKSDAKRKRDATM